MSAAMRLAQLQTAAGGGEPLSIAVLEKAREVGAHMLSGAVLDPSALRDLVPDFISRGRAARGPEVGREDVYVMTRTGKLDSPLRRRRCESRELHHLAQSVREVARPAGGIGGRRRVHGFRRGGGALRWHRVVGVRTGDRGIDRHGQKKVDLRARRRHPRKDDDFLPTAFAAISRKRSAPARAARRAPAAAVRNRHQGTVGSADGPDCRRVR